MQANEGHCLQQWDNHSLTSSFGHRAQVRRDCKKLWKQLVKISSQSLQTKPCDAGAMLYNL